MSSTVIPDQASRRGPGDSAEVWAPLLLVLTWAGVMHRQLFLGQTTIAGDTLWVFFPLRALGAVRLRAGELGVWDPHVFGGLPFAADPQAQVFYPFHLLLGLMSVPAAMSASQAAHYLLLLGGSYLLGRYSLRVAPWPAAVLALAFGLSAPAVTRSLVPCYPEALAWMPWALLAADWYMRRGGAARAVAPPVVVAVQLLTGAPQYTYYTLLAMLGMSAWRGIWGPPGVPRRRAALCVPTVAVGAALLAMIQLLPTLEMSRLTDRAAQSDYGFATSFSLPTGHFLAALLYPTMYGSAETPELEGFATTEYTGYVGIVALSLALVGLAGSTRRRLAGALAAAAGVSVFLAAGAHNPLYPLLYRCVPGLSLFRCPGRAIVLADLALAALAALGAATLGLESWRQRGLCLAAALLPLAAGAALLPSALAHRNEWQYVVRPHWPVSQLVTIVASCLAVGLLVVVSGPGRPAGRHILTVLCTSVLALDLLLFSQTTDLASTVPNALLTRTPSTVRAERASGSLGRHWSASPGFPLRRYLANRLDVDPAEFRASNVLGMLELLPSDLPAAYQVDGLDGAWGAMLPLARHVPSLYRGECGPSQKQWLSLLGVRFYAAAGESPFVDGLTPLPGPDSAVTLWEDPHAAPRAFLAARAEGVRDFAEAISRIEGQPSLPWSRTVYVEGLAASARDQGPADVSGAELQWQARSPERQVLLVDVPQTCWLVVSDNYYPGWKALVDREAVAVHPANAVMRAVPVPPGRHKVTLWYLCSALCVGGFVTLCALAACAALGVGPLIRALRPAHN